MKELVIGATFEFELYEPKIDRAGKSSMKRAVVDGHFDNLRLIYKKNSFDDFPQNVTRNVSYASNSLTHPDDYIQSTLLIYSFIV